MKKITKTIFLILIFLFAIAITKVQASTTGLSASSTQVTQGTSVTVTASVTSGAWNLTLSGAGQSKGLVGQTGTTDNSSASTSITFTASSVGSYTFTLSGDVTDYYTDENAPVNKSITINVTEPPVVQAEPEKNDSEAVAQKPAKQTQTTTKPETKKNTIAPVEEKKLSSDALLSSIKVEEGSFFPEFNPEIKEYTLMVENEITEVNVSAITNNEKASYSIEGNKELQIGENIVKVIVIAEDGTANEYIIKVNRGRAALAMQSLIIKYTNQEGKLIEAKLNPNFSPDVLEYAIDNLEYWVKKLDIEAIANLEGAIIEIDGADELHDGENEIVITVKIPKEVQEEGQDQIQYEVIQYKIKVIKEAKPTLVEKVKDWFKGIFGGITTWYNNNTKQVILISLSMCVIALAVVSLYIALDYQKYKALLEKLRKLNNINSAQVIKEMPDENIINSDSIIEENKDVENKKEETFEENLKTKSGRHF